MRILFKIFVACLLISSFMYAFSWATSAALKNKSSETLTFLSVGFDDSPSNTDVLGVITYDVSQNTVRMVQIPRDTAVDIDGVNKINSFYSKKVLEGKTHQEALEALKEFTSELLGIEIDGYIALTSQGFKDAVDFIGGVDINTELLPDALVRDMQLSGKTHFSGAEALSLVRYRKGYVKGDIERLDTQKIFLRALAVGIRDKKDKFSLLRFIKANEGLSFSVDGGRAFSFVSKNIFKIMDGVDVQIATLPGRAEKNGDTWYYLIDKDRADALLSGYFPDTDFVFDVKGKFIYDF